MSRHRNGLDPNDFRREELLRHLAEHFPNGSSPRRLELTIIQLRKCRFKIDDVAEAFERIIVTREQQTFPPIALIVRVCNEVRGERVRRDRGETPSDDRYDFSDNAILARLDDFRADRQAYGPKTRNADGELVPDYQHKSDPTLLRDVLDEVPF